MQLIELKWGFVSMSRGRTFDQAPSAPIMRSKSSDISFSWCENWTVHVVSEFFERATCVSLCSHLILSSGIEERSKSVSVFREISGRSPSMPSSLHLTSPFLSAKIVSSLHSLLRDWNCAYRPQRWRARRPDSAWRSREPEGTRGDVGCGVVVVVEGEGRRS